MFTCGHLVVLVLGDFRLLVWRNENTKAKGSGCALGTEGMGGVGQARERVWECGGVEAEGKVGGFLSRKIERYLFLEGCAVGSISVNILICNVRMVKYSKVERQFPQASLALYVGSSPVFCVRTLEYPWLCQLVDAQWWLW